MSLYDDLKEKYRDFKLPQDWKGQHDFCDDLRVMSHTPNGKPIPLEARVQAALSKLKEIMGE